MTDIGVSCQKNTYTVGSSMPICSAGQDYDAGLCYNKCKSGFTGVGPVCWQKCHSESSFDCGAICTPSSLECAGKILDITEGIVEAAVGIAAVVEGDVIEVSEIVKGIAGTAKALTLPICS
jgi:hypothetical protein